MRTDIHSQKNRNIHSPKVLEKYHYNKVMYNHCLNNDWKHNLNHLSIHNHQHKDQELKYWNKLNCTCYWNNIVKNILNHTRNNNHLNRIHWLKLKNKMIHKFWKKESNTWNCIHSHMNNSSRLNKNPNCKELNMRIGKYSCDNFGIHIHWRNYRNNSLDKLYLFD